MTSSSVVFYEVLVICLDEGRRINSVTNQFTLDYHVVKRFDSIVMMKIVREFLECSVIQKCVWERIT